MTRRTRQRAAVVAVLDALDGFSGAQAVHARLRTAGGTVGPATVHRTVQALLDDGGLDSIRTGSGAAAHRRCSTWHHHLACRTCGRTVEVAGPTVERWADRVDGEPARLTA